MTATIRPSLILNMDVDERQFSDDMVAEIKRSYSYVAPSVVAAVPASADAPIENTIRLVARMHRPYWDANDEAAQEQWAAVMPKWLSNMFYKVSSTVTACNDVRHKADQEPLPYAWMEVEFGDNMTVAQATEASSAFPGDALAVIEAVRDLMAAGTLGEGVARVSVPARSLWEEARAAAWASESVEGAEDEAVEAAAEAADVAEAVEAAAATDDLVGDGAAMAAEAVAADGAEGAADEAAPADEASAALPFAPDFAVDRSVWGVEYADGAVRLFDSAAGAFID